jgi:hypothetical protein
MSRIEDDKEAQRRQAAREAERRAADLKKEQRRTDGKDGEQSRFAQTLAKKSDDPKRAATGRGTEAAQQKKSKERADAPAAGTERGEERSDFERTREGLQQSTLEKTHHEGEQQVHKRKEGAEDKLGSQRKDEEALAQKGAGGDPKGKVGKGKGAKDKGDAKGDQGKGGGGDREAGAFKVPPSILMQSPPVRQPVANQPPSSRTVAQSLIEKIVERVRVGVNRQGLPEFQIDMKADILGGVMIKLTAKKGQVRAHFKGERKVLAMIRQEEDNLREALGKKGLELEALELEEA